MKYKPQLVSATPRRKFHAPGYSAMLLADIRTAGLTQYAYLFVVYGQYSDEPEFIVSSEFFAGGPDTVLGVFDGNGHQTLYDEPGGWTDETKFAAQALLIANERLNIALKDQPRSNPWWRFW